MRRLSTQLALIALGWTSTGLANPAAAQDVSQLAGLLASATEAYGQSFGEAATGGSSVFVTATGRAKLPAPLIDAYPINLEGRATSAVAASKLRDDRLAAARAIAQRFNVSVEIGSSTFSREVDTEAQQKRNSEVMAERAAHPGVPIVEPPLGDADRVFIARTGVRFRAADPSQLPAFLDALKAAGIDYLTVGQGLAGLGALFGRSEVLGFGGLDKVDDSIWDRASQNAVAAAQRQAAVLASAAGRQLGPAKQIVFLTRSTQGDTVSVTVAARFAFLPKS
jgi:hypothetical protein